MGIYNIGIVVLLQYIRSQGHPSVCTTILICTCCMFNPIHPVGNSFIKEAETMTVLKCNA